MAEVPWAVHVLAAQPSSLEHLQFETDRARFLGRGPHAGVTSRLDPDAVLCGTTGPVLDPIFSLRGQLHIAPDESASLAFMTGYAASREEALQLADQFRDPRSCCARLKSHGRKARSSCAICTCRPPACSYTSGWPPRCSIPTRHCVHRRPCSRRIASVSGRCGGMVFRATIPSSCFESASRTTAA